MSASSKTPHKTRPTHKRVTPSALSRTDQTIYRLASRKRGVCGREIMDALNWRSASARIEAGRIAQKHGLKLEIIDQHPLRVRLT